MHARVMREAEVWAAVTLNVLSVNFNPPAKKEHPKTRSKLERMDPSKEVWTILSWSWSRAAIPTMISTAFPNEAFRRPESVWPSFNDNCSVASPNSLARGIMAIKLNENLRAASQFRLCEMKLRGTNTSRTFIQDPKKKYLYDWIHPGWSSGITKRLTILSLYEVPRS